MSFDIYVISFRDGEHVPIDRAVLNRIMKPGAPKDAVFSNVEFSDGSGGEIYGNGRKEISSLGFSHFGGELFMEALFELARQTHSAVYWPSDPLRWVVADAETLRHVPKAFSDIFSPVRIVQSGREIDDHIVGH